MERAELRIDDRPGPAEADLKSGPSLWITSVTAPPSGHS